MMKKILETAGDLRFAFYLLIASAVIMWVGSIYSTFNYALINSLNGAPLIKWIISTGINNLSVTWWIPVMFLIFTLLGINTLACTINRISKLLPRRMALGTKKFLVLISPSAVHLLFILMLAGHLLSFAFVEQQKVPVYEGAVVTAQGIDSMTVKSIKYEYFPDTSLLKGRVKQSEAEITYTDKGQIISDKIAFMKPVIINGNILILDMEKKKQESIVKPDPAPDNCNKEHKFNYSTRLTGEAPQLYFLVINDPGLFILIPGFCIVIIIMVWYFVMKNTSVKDDDLF